MNMVNFCVLFDLVRVILAIVSSANLPPVMNEETLGHEVYMASLQLAIFGQLGYLSIIRGAVTIYFFAYVPYKHNYYERLQREQSQQRMQQIRVTI